MTGPLAYWDLDDVEKSLAGLVAAGATVTQSVRHVGGGKLIATVTDADGNAVGLGQAS